MPPLTNVAITTTSNGPIGDDGRNVLAYDLTTGALVASCELPGAWHPGSIVYRPNYDDLLVTTTGPTGGGTLHRLTRALTLVTSTNLAVPPGPSTDLLAIDLVRSDFHGGLYVTYQTSPSGTAPGDQLLRQIDPVTFAPIEDWRTFLTPDSRSLIGGDFALDGQTYVFAMRGGTALAQNVIYQLTLATGFATAWATYGTYSGGVNPTGNTYDARFIRPRAAGTFVAATHLLSGTDGNTLNELLLLAADGTVTAHYPLDPTLPAGTHLYTVEGLAVSGTTAWFVTGNGILARMDLTTGVQTTIVETGINGLNDLVVFVDEDPPVVYTLDERHIRRLRRAPHVNAEHKRVFFRSFELDLERGQGLATGQGDDPLITLRLSRDGGQTWGEPVPLHAGRLGAYTQRVIARRLGQARDTVFEVTVSDPVAWSLVGAWLELEPGTH